MDTCYICLNEVNSIGNGANESENASIEPTISPCKCKHVIHVHCLFDWIKKRTSNHLTCEICKSPYKGVGIREISEKISRRAILIACLIILLFLVAAIVCEFKFNNGGFQGGMIFTVYMFSGLLFLSIVSCVDRKNHFDTCIKMKSNVKIVEVYLLGDSEEESVV